MTINSVSKTTKTSKNQWLAELNLTFSQTAQGSRLSHVKRNGPLSVQKAFYPEGPNCAHVYLLHPPAGIVSGDELRISTKVESDAHALLTTPGANRFYRAREDLSIGDSKQQQIGYFELKANATLENFPLETLVYEGADGINTVDVRLSSSSVYLGWDITCLGLPSCNQPFVKGKFTQLNRIFCDDKLVYHDRISITPENNLLHHPAGLASQPVFATLVIAAFEKLSDINLRRELLDKIREDLRAQKADNLVSITDINGILVARYLGKQCEQCKRLFIDIWQHVRPSCLNKDANIPRIWYT